MTDEECQKVLDKLVNYYWSQLRKRMLLLGESYEEASAKIQEQAANA